MQLRLVAILTLLFSLLILGCTRTSGPPPESPPKAAATVDDNQAILQDASADTAAIEAQKELANEKRISAEADYEAWSLNHAEDVYEWQHISTIVIFVVVILLMVVGVIFSWIQFRQGMHHYPGQAIASTVSTIAQPASSGDIAQASSEIVEKSSVTEFSASPQGIKVASSTLGVIILVISMCFFYMYLVYVYPISIRDANQAMTAGKTAAQK